MFRAESTQNAGAPLAGRSCGATTEREGASVHRRPPSGAATQRPILFVACGKFFFCGNLKTKTCSIADQNTLGLGIVNEYWPLAGWTRSPILAIPTYFGQQFSISSDYHSVKLF